MSNSDVLEKKLKIVLLGKSGVGKTQLVARFFTDVLNEYEISVDSEVGAIHMKRRMKVDGVSFDIEIWDTAGNEKYDSMALMYLDQAVVIICYDITDSLSFMKAKDWMLQLTIYSCKIYLCATKNDLCNKNEAPNPPLNSVQEYAKSIKKKFFVTSSRTGENVSELFYTIIKDFISSSLTKKELKKHKRTKKTSSWKCCWKSKASS
ncbi:ras-related protein Rab-24 [Harpegnathos saltator]|uniref:ras-related protein Rab-24 n=1 Tax=Harpegnathos saltator TaxID=610380 RepID=UPI00058C8C5E|nr:ras-related protein Rab-24 [Harpegnathos saltator]